MTISSPVAARPARAMPANCVWKARITWWPTAMSCISGLRPERLNLPAILRDYALTMQEVAMLSLRSIVRFTFALAALNLMALPARAEIQKFMRDCDMKLCAFLSLIHISEPTRQAEISYAVFCLK